MNRRAVWIGLLAGVNLGASLLATLAVAAFAGSPERSDAWLVALAVPQFLIGAMQAGLITSTMPVIAGEAASVQAGRARLLALAIALPALLVALALAGTAPQWMPLLAAGLPPAASTLASDLARQQLLALPLAGVVVVLSVRGQSAGGALAVEAAGAASAALFVAALALLVRTRGIDQAGWLVPARWAVNTALLAGFARGGAWPPNAAGILGGVARKFSGFFTFGALYQSGVVVDRFLLSFAAPGTVSAYAIVSGVVLAGASVLEKGLTAPALPELFGLAKQNNLAGLRRRQLRLQRVAGVAGVASAMALAVAGVWLLALVGRALPVLAGREATMFACALLLLPCLAAVPAGAVASAAVNAKGAASRLLGVVVMCWAVGLAIKALGFLLAGVVGVALGASVYFVLAFFVLDWISRS